MALSDVAPAVTLAPTAAQAWQPTHHASGLTVELNGICARHAAARAGAPAALRGVSLRVQAGEQVVIIGPSGAGKTTLLHVLACALPPEQGQFTVGGASAGLGPHQGAGQGPGTDRDHGPRQHRGPGPGQGLGVSPWALPRSALQRLRGRLFLAPQVPPLPPRQRVVTAVLAGRLPSLGLWASLAQLFYPRAIPAAHNALAAFDLQDKLFERVDRLSGGERQRVALARALVAPAQLWLVDEPLSALDPTRAEQALATLVREARARGVTLIASLHQVEMALAHFARIVGLREGQVVFDLPANAITPQLLAQLYAQHEHELHATGPMAEAPPEPAPQAATVRMNCR